MIQENENPKEEVRVDDGHTGPAPAEGESRGSSEMIAQLEDQSKRIHMLSRALVKKSLSRNFGAWKDSNGITTDQEAFKRLDNLVLDELAITVDSFDSSTDPEEKWTIYIDQIFKQGLLAELLNIQHRPVTDARRDQLRQLSRVEV